MSRYYALPARFAEPKPAEITLDTPLPLEEAVCLHFEGNDFHIPYPISSSIPLYEPENELICGFYRRGDQLVVATFNEHPTRTRPKDPYEQMLRGGFHLTEIGTMSCRKIGYFSLVEKTGRTFSLVEKTGRTEKDNPWAYLDLRGLIQQESGEITNLSDLYQENDPFAVMIVDKVLQLCAYRYNINRHMLNTSGSERWYVDEDFNKPLMHPSQRVDREIQGTVEHDAVKSIVLPRIPLGSNRKLIFPEGRTFPLSRQFHSRDIPIVGVYTHPHDERKITVARLLEQKSGRNRLLITEVEEAERDIGYLYFRVLPQKILVDGFSIGEGSMIYIAPEEAEQFRGKGLGTRVLETAERLFKKRYGASFVEFESEMVFSKEGIHDDPERFFRRNGYGLRMTSDWIGNYAVASFEKRI